MSAARVLEPADAESAAQLLAEARAAGDAVLPCGQRRRLARHSPEAAPDAWLSSARLQKIVKISPDDQTCEVEAGVTAAALDAALAPHGLELAVDAPHAETGSLGGLFLSPDLSLLQAAWGPPRDQVLGARWLLADGAVVNTGARVVKSVAGYDVTRLLLGSRGRLAFCLRLVLRLRPRPRAARWSRVDPARLDAWLHPDPRVRIPARRLLMVQDAGGMQVCAETDGIEVPAGSGADALDPAAAREMRLACLQHFGELPQRAQLTRRELAAVLAAGTPVCADLLAGTVGFARDQDLEAAPGALLRAFPRRTSSTWLADLQRACAPGAPAFGNREATT